MMRYPPAPEKGLPEYLQATYPDEIEKDENPMFQNRKSQ